MVDQAIKEILEEKARQFNHPDFIESDPISIPHQFTKKQDIEIAGFFAAMFSWGQRKTIINKSNELLSYMDHAPYDFILNHTESDLKRVSSFKHRTFNTTDTLYFIAFFKHWYSQHDSLEEAFNLSKGSMEQRIASFYDVFFSLDFAPQRTRKHVSTPKKKSACKRVNMFLRWMVRKDDCGVDFGIWDSISMKDLICPLDVHVDRIGRQLGLLKRKQNDWLAATELTTSLQQYNSEDPVLYDFALFGLGIEGRSIFLN